MIWCAVETVMPPADEFLKLQSDFVNLERFSVKVPVFFQVLSSVPLYLSLQFIYDEKIVW